MTHEKHFSMIRDFHLADWLTLGNAACGVGALFAVMNYLRSHEVMHLFFACALIPLALAFDVFDGRVARWRKQTSAMGGELDLVVTFPNRKPVKLKSLGEFAD